MTRKIIVCIFTILILITVDKFNNYLLKNYIKCLLETPNWSNIVFQIIYHFIEIEIVFSSVPLYSNLSEVLISDEGVRKTVVLQDTAGRSK